jgi:hypothetical protein
MKKLYVTFVVFLFSIPPGHAETCREHFIRIFAPTDKTVKSIRTYNTTIINGGEEQKFNIFSIGRDHVLSQALVPAAPWSLIYNKQMFISSDKGKTWIKARDLPNIEMDEVTLKAKEEAVKKIGNEKCGIDTYDGKKAVTVQADLDITPEAPFKTTVKYWIDIETKDTLKSTTEIINQGTNYFTTQIFEQAPGLVLPMPK